MTLLVKERKLIMAVIMASSKARNLQSQAQKFFVTLVACKYSGSGNEHDWQSAGDQKLDK